MDLSLIVPVYNEEESVPHLYEAIRSALGPLNLAWEVLFVEDGSRDRSLEALKSLTATDPAHVRVIVFRRNFGQTAAIVAGIDHATGKTIVLLDADLQNDPADIPMLLSNFD